MTAEAIAELIRSRRTINFFKPDPPPKELVLQALDAARWAPNHHLTEPWRFYLLGRETAEAVARLNARLVMEKKGVAAGEEKLQRWLAMPGYLAVTCVKSDSPVQAREDYAACCCAVQNAMLALWGEGVGCKWGTGVVTRHAEFYDLLWIDPEVEETVGLFFYGYPEEIPVTPRKPLSEVLVELP